LPPSDSTNVNGRPRLGRPPRLLVLSQVYVPDPAAVGQHMAEAAAEMARRGWDVVVLTSARGYNDPSVRYKRRETIDGVDVRRLPLSSFGKRGFAIRILAAILFMSQTILRGLFMQRPDAIIVSTSPPMCIVAALVIRLFRRADIKFWVMDINPEQLEVLGHIKPGSLAARMMDAFNRMILKRSTDVVVLDRFMGDTMCRKLDVSDKMSIIPPWPHEDHVTPVPHEENPFRKEHGLDGRFVFMYSGNHGLALPLETMLQAAVACKDDPRAMFVFIGDGARKHEVDDCIREHALTNMLSLPYQPMDRLRYSLSAADVHLISVGDGMVGVIHPCKVYGAMAAARPVLLFGPDPCHVSDIMREGDFGWHVQHGDVEGAIEAYAQAMRLPREEWAAMGARARRMVDTTLSKGRLCGRFCDVVAGSGVSGQAPSTTTQDPAPAHAK